MECAVGSFHLTLAYRLLPLLRGTGTTLFFSDAVEDGYWWMLALYQGQDRWGEPGMRATQFRTFFRSVVGRPCGGPDYGSHHRKRGCRRIAGKSLRRMPRVIITSSEDRRISLERLVSRGRRFERAGRRAPRVRCVWTGRDKPNPRAAIRFREFVANLFFESRHRRRARRVGVVNEHRRVEIPGGKHFANVSEVSSNLIDARFIFRVVGPDVDSSSVVEQSEMMHGRFVRKAHDMFTTLTQDVHTACASGERPG